MEKINIWSYITTIRTCLYSILHKHAKLLQSSLTLWPYGLQPARHLCPWDSLGKNTGVGCHALQIYKTQGLNLHLSCLLHWQVGSSPLVPRGKPILYYQFSSVLFSRSVVSDSLRLHEPQNTRPPCPSPGLGVYSNSCPSSWRCHPTISSSVVPFSSCPQSLPASGSFPVSQLFTWDGQSTGVSASASVLPMNTQDWSPLGWTYIILSSVVHKRISRWSLPYHIFFS